MHFQPDLPVGSANVVKALTREDVYRSLSEAGVSNGGLAAFAAATAGGRAGCSASSTTTAHRQTGRSTDR